MMLSLSVCVCLCVRPSLFFLLVSLKCLQKVSWGFQLRLKGVSSSFKGVSRAFERSLKGVSGKF